MKPIWDFDNGNGVYDVVTRQDYERWKKEEQDRKERDRESQKKSVNSLDVPF